VKYRIHLKGPRAKGGRVPADVLRDLLAVLTEGTRRSLRLRLEGRSLARGPIPSWLGKAAAFDLVGLAEGSTVLEFEATPLASAAPERFGQPELFNDIDVGMTSLGFLQESLRDALAGKEESDLYDQDLIATYSDLGGVLAAGFESVEIVGEGSLEVRPEGIELVKSLRRKTPSPRRVRVAGALDAIRYSDRMFTLVLASGKTLRGVAESVDPERLRALFGREAVVSGRAVFRPSGSVLRIEAAEIEPATGDTSMWSDEPRPLEVGLDVRELSEPQGPRSGVSAIFGRWPGEESDEEIASAFEEIS
jgi:hypothetical protein